MATGNEFDNPNEVLMNSEEQVMSRPNVPPPQTLVNGVVGTARREDPMDMDGETVNAEVSSSSVNNGNSRPAPVSGSAQPSDPGQGTANTSDRPVSSTSTARGFLLGPENTRVDHVPPLPSTTTSLGGGRRGPPAFLSGVAKAVQSLPAAVEGLMSGHANTSRGMFTGEGEEYVSVQSGSSEVSRRSPADGQGPSTPLLDERTLRTLGAHQVTAPHLYTPEAPPSGGRPPSTTSSDIQAEVRRQLHEYMALRDGEMALRNEENAALRSRLEQLTSENQVLRHEISTQVYSVGNTVRSEGTGGFPGLGWFSRGLGNFMTASTSSKTSSPAARLIGIPPPPHTPPTSVVAQRTEAPKPPVSYPCHLPDYRPNENPLPPVPVQPAPCPPPVASQGACSVQRSLDFGPTATEVLPPPKDGAAPMPRPDPDPSGTVLPPSGAQDPLQVVLTGMAQLQGMVAGLANSPKNEQKYETIKPGVNSLPELPAPGPEACLQFADWLHASKPALSDVSDSSELLWDQVMKEAQAWYKKYLAMDAIARLSSKPKPSEEITQPRWSRVSRRIETMVIAAAPTSIKEELSAARVTGLLAVVSKLFVIYSPGGLGEREIGLRNIQEPSPGSGLRDSVDLLRKWKRWCDRMTELGGVLPDPALRVKALDKITRAVFQTHPEAAFRVNLTRAALQIDSTPDGEKVIQLHAQMLAELESLTHRSVPKEGDKARDSSQTANPKVKGVETSDVSSPPKNPKPGRGTPKQNSAPKATGNDAAGSGGVPCSFYTSQTGCKKGADCTFVHNWSAFSPAERASRCKTCGAKTHKSNECRAGVKGEEKAKYKSPPVNPKGPVPPKPGDGTGPSHPIPPSNKFLTSRSRLCLLTQPRSCSNPLIHLSRQHL